MRAPGWLKPGAQDFEPTDSAPARGSAAAFRELGLDEVRARNQARLTYSVYLGFLQLQRQHQTPHLSSEEFEDYIEHVISTLIPD